MRTLLCGLVFVCVTVLGQSTDGPLLPPRQRIDEHRALAPLIARKEPIKSSFQTPVAVVLPTPSAAPSAIPVDPQELTIGNCIEHRTYMDFPERLQLIFPGIRFPGLGAISAWDVYTGRDCLLKAQVFRPIGVPKALDANQHPVSNYELVGSNELSAPAMGHHSFEVPEADQIHVQKGDVLGFYTEMPGCVSWSDGGPISLYRYGYPGHNELKALDGFVFIGDGVHRTYSISCSGRFQPDPHELMHRVSPTSSVSSSPSVLPSRSPTHSPSGSISVTPIQTPSPSTTAMPSASYSNSISLSPSTSPSPLNHENDCSKGVAYWCASAENMVQCNMTPAECEAVLGALNPALPSTFPTVSPPSSPSSNVILRSPYPSPTPSMSLVIPPYAAPPSQETEGTGATSCHYCNGGNDWTGGQCLTGENQSPISLKFDDVSTDTAMNLYFSTRYNFSRARLGWNDYAFTLTPQGGSFGSINVDGVNYDAEMAYIRAPSEHKLEGSRTPLEIQIFHKKRDSNPPQVMAVAVLFEETAEEVHSMDWIYAIPADKSDIQVVVNLDDYLSDLKPLMFYNGSFTQPPCTEGITWAVTMGSAKVAFLQMKVLNRFMKDNKFFANGRGNNRGVQPLNGRTLLLRSNCGMSGSIECGGDGPVSAKTVPLENGGAVDDGSFDDDGTKLW